MAINKSLLALNFFSADVRDGLGPYLAIYLGVMLQWEPGAIGIALAVSTIATVAVQPFAGAIIDRSERKRMLLIVSALAIAAAAVAMPYIPWDGIVYASQVAIGAAGAFVPPTIAAITLGIVGQIGFTQQTSANEAANHTGNVVTAILVVLLAEYVSPLGVFWLLIFMALGMLISVLTIKPALIDHVAARGGVTQGEGHKAAKPPRRLKLFLEDRRLLVFAICIVLFHFANAAMLPLVSQKLSANSGATLGIEFTSACIIAAQFVMILMAALCGRTADSWGRKPLFILAFAILPFRGLLYTIYDVPYFLVAVQALDGVANGIFGVLFLLITADITRGSGHFNLAQGVLTALVGVGAASSNIVAEQIVQFAGFNPAFYFLSGVAAVGLLVFVLFMPETAPHARRDKPEPAPVV
ncbi:MAG: MFS transporter [Rhodospirillales bacterium]